MYQMRGRQTLGEAMKKIAIVADGWRKFISYAWIGGSRKYIEEHQLDADLYVFNSFGNFSKDEKYNTGEYNIINLPDFREFDGILLDLSNVDNPQVRREILDKIQCAGVPAISLVDEVPGMCYAGINNYAAMKHMVEHMVEVHGCRTLNYIGGPENSWENRERFRAYRDVLQQHGISVEDRRVRHFNYEIMAGEEAFDYFLEQELLPEVFICANDNIAVGICHQAQTHGYEVPGDFYVTGFDNFDKASYFHPRITTVGVTREDIAYEAVGLLEKIWAGDTKVSAVYVDAECVFQDSCSCVPTHKLSRGKYVIDHIFAEDTATKLQNEMMTLKRALINCDSFEELAECIPQNLKMLCCDEMYILMNPDIITCEDVLQSELREDGSYLEQTYHVKGYPEEMAILVASREDELLEEVHWQEETLFPGQENSGGGNMFLFSPLHFRDREVGYMVLKNCDYMMDAQMLFEVVNVLMEAMENLHNRMTLNRMNQELSMLYVRDSLTGLYNRMAYSRFALPMFERCMRQKAPLLIMFLDLDRLKYINDNFGHDMGNLAIKTIASAMQMCCPQEGIAIRYGGDEFVLLIPGYDEEQTDKLIVHMESMISRTEKSLDPGFPIGASMGYVIARDDSVSLNEYINLADEKMYANKKAKKAQRQ